MDLEQLKYFQSVANTENISRSARELYVSQPSVSKALTRLEEELGYSLFNREKGRICLNDDGRLFLDYVERAFGELNTAIEKLDIAHNRESGLISVAGLCGSAISTIIRDYLSQNNGISIRLKYGTGRETVEQLVNYELDFAVLNYAPDDPHLINELIYEEPIYLVVSREHPLAGRTEVSLTELRNERFICNDNYVSRELTVRFCGDAGFVPDIVADSNDNRLSEELAEKNVGIYLVPEQRVLYWKTRFTGWKDLVSFMRISDPIKYTVYVSRRARQSSYPINRDFYKFAMDYMLNHKEELSLLPEP